MTALAGARVLVPRGGAWGERVAGELGYIAWINNTWSQHLHVGIRDADRAVRICTAMRSAPDTRPLSRA